MSALEGTYIGPEEEKIFLDAKEKPQHAALAVTEPNLMSMIQYAVEHGTAIEVLKELRAMRDADRAYAAKRAYDDAMNLAQDEIGEVPPDCINTETKKPYASYRALIRAIKPVAKKHGFTLSFSSEVSAKPDEILVTCECTHSGGGSRTYMVPMPNDGKGAKGGGVMSKSHATIAATSFGRGTLLKMIFNLDIGEEVEHEKVDDLQERLEFIANCRNNDELKQQFAKHYSHAESLNDRSAMDAIIQAKNKKYREMNPGTERSRGLY